MPLIDLLLAVGYTMCSWRDLRPDSWRGSHSSLSLSRVSLSVCRGCSNHATSVPATPSSGRASVTMVSTSSRAARRWSTWGGDERARLGPGDYFGDVALIDQRERSATVAAATELRCYRLSSSEFRRFAESDITIAWALLRMMARRLRVAEGASGPVVLSPPA